MFWRRRPRDEPAQVEPSSRPEAEEAEEAAEVKLEPPIEAAEVPPSIRPDIEEVGDAQDAPGEAGPAIHGAVEASAVKEAPTQSSAAGAAEVRVGVVPATADSTVLAAGAHDLGAGLARTRGGFMARLRGLFGSEDETAWDDVEETLIAGDVGAGLAIRIVEGARARRDQAGPEAAVRAELAALLVERDPSWSPRPSAAGGPAVILVVGVNGTGKTTTIGKLAARYREGGNSVLLAAADTFRAAAIEQLEAWAVRAGATVVAHAPGADPGAVVYDALDAAIARKVDIVIADTAGRLHTKVNLMDELAKVRRVIDKRLPGAVPETFFVLDATTGQNGLTQAKAFHDTVGLTGIVLTKLDSTAKGGIVFAIEDGLHVPVRYVGVGEQVGDLLPFDPEAFVAALFA